MLDRVFIEETNVFFFISDCMGLFQKYFDSLCYRFKVLHTRHCLRFPIGFLKKPYAIIDKKKTLHMVRSIFDTNGIPYSVTINFFSFH